MSDRWREVTESLIQMVLKRHLISPCSNVRCELSGINDDRGHCLRCESYEQEYGGDEFATVEWPCEEVKAALAARAEMNLHPIRPYGFDLLLPSGGPEPLITGGLGDIDVIEPEETP